MNTLQARCRPSNVLKIRQMADINESAIQDYVAQAVMLNAKKGDPTKKGNA